MSLDLKLLDETLARLRRIAEQNADTATCELKLFGDQYELPIKHGQQQRRLIAGGQEFILILNIPATDLPEGAVLVPRVDVQERMRASAAGEFNTGEE